tara:strand:+ start:683 stop:958 length:276 start_codon:yes stop_codon:yes gene_type:complete
MTPAQIRTADLHALITLNAFNLEGDVVSNNHTGCVEFRVREMYAHDVVATMLENGSIIDTTDGFQNLYENADDYATFLRCEDDACVLGTSI